MQQNDKHCASNEYGSYSTWSLARSACDSDSDCRGVYDEYCDNLDSFTLCHISAALEESPAPTHSCVYDKVFTTGS